MLNLEEQEELGRITRTWKNKKNLEEQRWTWKNKKNLVEQGWTFRKNCLACILKFLKVQEKPASFGGVDSFSCQEQKYTIQKTFTSKDM